MALKFKVYIDGADANKPKLEIKYSKNPTALDEQVMEYLSDLANTGGVGYNQVKTVDDALNITTLVLTQGT